MLFLEKAGLEDVGFKSLDRVAECDDEAGGFGEQRLDAFDDFGKENGAGRGSASHRPGWSWNEKCPVFLELVSPVFLAEKMGLFFVWQEDVGVLAEKAPQVSGATAGEADEEEIWGRVRAG